MDLTAKDIMTAEVYTVSPSMTVVDMDHELLDRKIGGAPVVGDDGQLLGVVSRSDIARKLSGNIDNDSQMWGAEGSLMAELVGINRVVKPAAEQLQTLTVREIMNDNAISVSPDEPVADLARKMVERCIHRLLVLDGGNLVGIISSLDLVGILARG